jgi:hypothetical protein
MGKKRCKNSDVVKCLGCGNYFISDEVVTHQEKEHAGRKWLSDGARFFEVSNNDVVHYLNQLQKIRAVFSALKELIG